MIRKSTKGIKPARISIDYDKKQIHIEDNKKENVVNTFCGFFSHNLFIAVAFGLLAFLFYDLFQKKNIWTNIGDFIRPYYSIIGVCGLILIGYIFAISFVMYNCDFHYSRYVKSLAGSVRYFKKFENVKGNEIKIPMFKNNILHFETNGNYGELLDKVDIKPLDAMMFKTKHKLVPQNNLWEAVFLFKQNLDGVDGSLEVKWK